MFHKFCRNCGLVYEVETDDDITECVECGTTLEVLSREQALEMGIVLEESEVASTDENTEDTESVIEESEAENAEEDEDDYLNTNKDGYYDSQLPKIEEEIIKSKNVQTIAIFATLVIMILLLVIIGKLLFSIS